MDKYQDIIPEFDGFINNRLDDSSFVGVIRVFQGLSLIAHVLEDIGCPL